jgi:hypothetical protein
MIIEFSRICLIQLCPWVYGVHLLPFHESYEQL